MRDMPMSERSFAERSRIAGEAWADAKAHASNLSDHAKHTEDNLKKPKFEAIKRAIKDRCYADKPNVADAQLERDALVSDEWADFLQEMRDQKNDANEAWRAANKARVEYDAIDMAQREWASANALRREEMNMHRGM